LIVWNKCLAAVCLAALIACSSRSGAPAPAETSPTGDIPDTQVFLTYESPARQFSILFPEGWSRSEQRAGVMFVQGFDGERVRLRRASASATAETATTPFQGVRDVRSDAVSLPSGKALRVTFTSTSLPDAVTGKTIRLTNNSYVISSGGRVAIVDLWAPLASDNVDQWRRISTSFRWR
jgi:hypothetical protein